MALYHNGTRFAAIVTIRILAVQDPKKSLEVGVASAMKAVEADLGVHDVHVGPSESIEVKPGVEADFLSVRGVS